MATTTLPAHKGSAEFTLPQRYRSDRRSPVRWIGRHVARYWYLVLLVLAIGGGYASPSSFRRELEREVGRRDPLGTYEQQYRPSASLDTLKRDVESIHSAIRETVHLLRDGRLVAEDFIRRYKDLMRDSYQTRREIERQTRETRDRFW